MSLGRSIFLAGLLMPISVWGHHSVEDTIKELTQKISKSPTPELYFKRAIEYRAHRKSKECEHARVGEPIRQCEKRGRHEGRSCITQTSRSHAPQVSRSHARASIRPNYDRITTEFVEDAPRRFATVAIDIALARTALENTCKKTRLSFLSAFVPYFVPSLPW